MTVRLYGRSVGHGSLSVVTSGFREVLDGAGLLDGFVALDKSGGSEEDLPPAGATARDAVFTGNLNLINAMRVGAKHERHWVQVTPNSTHIPPKLLGAVLQLPNVRILSASAWGTTMIGGALGEMGLRYIEDGNIWLTYLMPGTNKTIAQVHTAHHGVSGFAPIPAELERTRLDYELGKFRVVHFSTTEGERKGTLELLQAWYLLRKNSRIPDKSELLLVLDHHARAALMQRLAYDEIEMPTGVQFLPRGDMDTAAMSRFICQQHLVCTPSRGEGFGLLPLQARACGVPVATTVTTGHSAGHCHGPGVIRILQDHALFSIDDGPDALAPRVEPREIADAIAIAHGAWNGLSHMAESFSESVAKKWSWGAQLAPLVKQLRCLELPAFEQPL